MAASSLGLQITETQVRNRGEIEGAFEDIQGVRDSGLLVLPEFITTMHRGLIAALAARHRIPSAYAHRNFAESGGLISYGVDYKSVYGRAASYVDRILRGEKAGDLPVQQ